MAEMDDTPEPTHPAFFEGQIAWGAKQRPGDNPYSEEVDPVARAEWERGWLDRRAANLVT